MPIFTFARTQVVPRSIEECWAFFADPGNLSKITPPALGFTVQTELPAQIYPGLMLRYTVSPVLNVSMTWLTEITQAQQPHYFVDEQLVGPYRLWHHEHFFRALNAERTEVRDLVHYLPPLGLLGAILNRLVIARQIARIFDFREAELVRLFGNAPLDSRA